MYVRKCLCEKEKERERRIPIELLILVSSKRGNSGGTGIQTSRTKGKLFIFFKIAGIIFTIKKIKGEGYDLKTWWMLISTKDCILFKTASSYCWEHPTLQVMDGLHSPDWTENPGLRLLLFLGIIHAVRVSRDVSWQLSDLFCGEFEATLSFRNCLLSLLVTHSENRHFVHLIYTIHCSSVKTPKTATLPI